MNKALNYLGLARRAGFLITGTDAVIASLENKARLVLVATDASSATKDKLSRKCYYYKVPMLDIYSTEEMANAIGQKNPKVIAITNDGFAKQILKINERGGHICE